MSPLLPYKLQLSTNVKLQALLEALNSCIRQSISFETGLYSTQIAPRCFSKCVYEKKFHTLTGYFFRRYCFLIFWWVEAVYASHSQDKERTREAILKARSASPVELYLFLQSFIHAAPHTVVNILDLLQRYTDLSFDQGNYIISIFWHSLY